MREVIARATQWRREGKAVAIATVVHAWGSSPRPVGSKMAVSSGGEMVGSVSGGCVEAAVVEEAHAVLASSEPKLVRYGVTDERAWAVGLSCGGTVEVFIAPASELAERVQASLDADRLVVLSTVIEGPGLGDQLLQWPGGRTEGALARDPVATELVAATADLFRSFECRRQQLENDERVFFHETFPPRSKLVIIGAVHVAIPLVELARPLGYRTIVIDPRAVFATTERFGHADELLQEWPDRALRTVGLDEGTFVVVLSHKLELDVPALQVVLQHPVRYVGALGSRKTNERRQQALRDAGVSDEEIARIRAPIGLDLGGRRAEQIALSIVAEMQAVHHGRKGRP